MNKTAKYKHKDCYFCGKGGFLFSEFKSANNVLTASMIIGKKHEGWPGLPHGGVGMTAIIELSDLQCNLISRHPWKASFRFGGDKIALGDEVCIQVIRNGKHCKASMSKKSGTQPYLSGIVEPAGSQGVKQELDDLLNFINCTIDSKNSFEIPVFSSRIIFKDEFQLKYPSRIFEYRETANRKTYMISYYNKENCLIPCLHMNRMPDGSVHPGALITLLDETLGWAGFLAVWQGGITVNLDIHFLQPAFADDSIFTVGYCTEIKGKYWRKMLSCCGGIIAVRGNKYVPLVYCTGRWLTKPEFKEKMLHYILPESAYKANLIHKLLNNK